MPVVTTQARTDPIDPHGVGLLGACRSLAWATEGATSCHGYHIRPVSPCVALSEIGDAGVPPLRTSQHLFPPGRDTVEAGDAGLFFSTCAWNGSTTSTSNLRWGDRRRPGAVVIGRSRPGSTESGDCSRRGMT